jgi:hypothetical protein
VAQLAQALVEVVQHILIQELTVQVFLAKVIREEMLPTQHRTVKVVVAEQVAQAVLLLEEPLITEVALVVLVYQILLQAQLFSVQVAAVAAHTVAH